MLFTTKEFDEISFEILTDTIKYIYYFELEKKTFVDTLKAYGYNLPKMLDLVKQMQALQCTWITKLDYYEGYTAGHLLLMAVRSGVLDKTLRSEKYCTLTFFDKAQPYDEKGRFLDRADRKRNRQINDYKLYRLTDRVGYSITKHYR
ncbi:MAG: hypothetical protein ACK5NK_11285 [Niabella sp.]